MTTDNLHEQAAARFSDFVEQFRQDNEPIYIQQIKSMKNSGKTTLIVNMRHLTSFDATFSTAILKFYYRFLPFLNKSLEYLVFKLTPSILYSDGDVPQVQMRLGMSLPHFNDNHRPIRNFQVAFDNVMNIQPIRSLQCHQLATLVTLQGTITRTSAVKPELLYGAFLCKECGTSIAQVEQQFKYTEPSACPNPTCQSILFDLQLQECKFINFQRLRIQESPDDIPSGAMPRTIEVICRHDMVEQCKAGDQVHISGCLLAIPDLSPYSFKMGGVELRRGKSSQNGVSMASLGARELVHKLVFLASHVQSIQAKVHSNEHWQDTESLGPNDMLALCSNEQKQRLLEMSQDKHIYSHFIQSMAPHIHGHDHIKKGLLLQLIGGVHKQTADMSLRGDINILMIGDPGTAKSQFLKYVCRLHPRSVFTSGRNSSAAGLTATVIRDEETNEFTIEAGALMLADQGICCIDEFEKMDIKDMVAIHEAMEQQTISISKAGIQATLNARTSILAACNPYGRYDKRKTIRQNVPLSAPILSRFDLVYVLCDDLTEEMDMQLSKMICEQHRQPTEQGIYSLEDMRHYIQFVRTIRPVLTQEAALYLSKQFKKSRLTKDMTIRQMESMIRLSEAIARLHGQNEVHVEFAKEAYRLMNAIEVDMPPLELQVHQETIQVRGSDYKVYKAHVMEVLVDAMVKSDLVASLLELVEDNIQSESELLLMERQMRAVLQHMVQEGLLVEETMDEDGNALEEAKLSINEVND